MKAKSLLISIGVIVGLALLVLLIWYILLVKAFTWKPPSTEFELTKKESIWKSNAELKYDFSIDFIGSDDSFMEDSVVYVNAKVSEESALQTISVDSFELIAKELSRSFQEKSTGRKEKTCIQFRFHHLLNPNISGKSEYSMDKVWLYHFKQNTIVEVD